MLVGGVGSVRGGSAVVGGKCSNHGFNVCCGCTGSRDGNMLIVGGALLVWVMIMVGCWHVTLAAIHVVVAVVGCWYVLVAIVPVVIMVVHVLLAPEVFVVGVRNRSWRRLWRLLLWLSRWSS